MAYLDYIAMLGCTTAFLSVWYYRTYAKLPPGPPGIFGNAYHIPRTKHWEAFKRFGDTYGPVICLWMFGTTNIVLNDYTSANALLNQRSLIYSSRGDFWMSGEIAQRKNVVFITKTDNPRFKIYRKLLHSTLNTRAISAYNAVMMQECRKLLKGFLERPDEFIAFIRKSAVATIMNVAFGYQLDSNDDKFVQILEESFQMSNELNVPGKFMVEFFPLLRFVPSWFPGAGFKRLALSTGKKLRTMDVIPFRWAKAQIESGSYQESFVSHHINNSEFATSQEEREDIIRLCSLSLYIGGGDTTVSTLITFVLLMTLYPEAQRRAQQEIDRVVGAGQTVTLNYKNSLPYVKALIKEVMRWGPVAPLGIPHEVTEDDVYEGYNVPKGSRVIANIWAMSHDEAVYPNPSEFDPTRFLGENQQMDPYNFVFGFGRRICPGMHLAEDTLFLNICNILSCFNISKKKDGQGQEIEPKIEWSTGITAHLKPFLCSIEPRSAEARSTILSQDEH